MSLENEKAWDEYADALAKSAKEARKYKKAAVKFYEGKGKGTVFATADDDGPGPNPPPPPPPPPGPIKP